MKSPLFVMRTLTSFALFTFLISVPFSASAQEAEYEVDAYLEGPGAPTVLSADYVDENTWYQPRNAAFSWLLPNEVTAVAAELTSAPDIEPDVAFRPPITEINISASEWREGVQYVAVQFRNEESWGVHTARKVMIDATSPEPFTAEISPYDGGQQGVIAKAMTTDSLSGVSHYEVSVNGQASERISIEEFARGQFISLDANATNNLRITAFDHAGNGRVFSSSILSLPPKEVRAMDDPLAYATSEPASLLASIMAVLLLLIFAYMVYERQRYALALLMLQKETDEVQSQMLRVFAALREEIYDHINAINRKTRLTKKEKEAVDSLNKSLSVSEKLLKKEVKDVKKLLS